MSIVGKLTKTIATAPIWLMRIVFILAILFFLSGLVPYFAHPSNAPSAADASWGIQTYIYVSINGTKQAFPSLIYYGKEFSMINGVPALAGYWDYDGKSYTYHDEIKYFTPKDWGSVSVIRRPG